MEESHEFTWKLENWPNVQQNKSSINAQITSCIFGKLNTVTSRWTLRLEVGTKKKIYIRVTLEEYESEFPTLTLAKLLVQHSIRGVYGPYQANEWGKIENQPITGSSQEWRKLLGWTACQRPEKWINHLGPNNPLLCLKIKILLTGSGPRLLHTEPKFSRWTSEPVVNEDEFTTRFVVNLQQDLNLLCDSSSNCGDIQIICSDEQKLNAHRLILKARNTVFASMLESDMIERNTGTVTVQDVSSRTMKLLLKYFYTGILDPTWSDPDNVCEFVYAAGKYQLADILDMLDKVLGTEKLAKASTMKLFKLAHQLSLKTAEKRLMKQLAAIATATENPEMFLSLFEIENEIKKSADSSNCKPKPLESKRQHATTLQLYLKYPTAS